MLKTAIGRLRVIGLAEGISFLVLLGIAMPLKYAAGMPMAVRVVGSIHGGLFVLFVGALLLAARAHRWSLSRVAGAFVASLVPFGTFVLDASLRREEEGASAQT
jgi:integral membrane protein